MFMKIEKLKTRYGFESLIIEFNVRKMIHFKCFENCYVWKIAKRVLVSTFEKRLSLTNHISTVQDYQIHLFYWHCISCQIHNHDKFFIRTWTFWAFTPKIWSFKFLNSINVRFYWNVFLEYITGKIIFELRKIARNTKI